MISNTVKQRLCSTRRLTFIQTICKVDNGRVTSVIIDELDTRHQIKNIMV